MEIYVIWKYANYFNRYVRLGRSISDYTEGRPFFNSSKNIAFDFADGITTSWVMNSNPFLPDLFDEAGDPDYLIVVDGSTDEKRIVSRWYVLEAVYLRKGQHRLDLRRDVVADYYDDVLLSPCVLERGPVSPDSPLVYNDEPGAFNQIKRSETLLKDESGIPWIVGYVSRDTSSLTVEASTESTGDYPALSDLDLDFIDPSDPSKGATFVGLPSTKFAVRWIYWTEVVDDALGLPKRSAWLLSNISTDGSGQVGAEEWWPPAFAPYYVISDNSAGLTSSNWLNRASEVAAWVSSKRRAKANTILSEMLKASGWKDPDETMALTSSAGKIFFDADSGKYYQLSIDSTSSPVFDETMDSETEHQALYWALHSAAKDAVDEHGAPLEYSNAGTINVYAVGMSAKVSLREVSPAGVAKVTVPASRKKLADAPYDMFCMPFTVDNLALAHAIAVAPLGEGEKKRVFDLQILPYCPRRDILLAGSVAGYTEDEDYVEILVSDGEEFVGTGTYMYWCLSSSDSFSIPAPSSLFRIPEHSSVPAIKASMKCDLFRLSSPNYSSAFEFSVAKNGGEVPFFRVDFTYKPISPYIHVAPFFSGLYGSVNDDARGLICSGDFSVDMISDAWTQYQTMNKNYQNIFDVRIKTMDSRHVWDVVGASFGAVGSVAGGAAAGAMKGGVPGAVAGAAVGMAGGAFGLASMQARYDLDREAQTKTFRYELDNVVAVPDTLTKVSAYNVNNKYFPLVEYYSSSDEERNLFLSYLEEFNYHVGAMTTIGAALRNRTKEREYVKGRMVRISGAVGNHEAAEIYAEIEKGVYFL